MTKQGIKCPRCHEKAMKLRKAESYLECECCLHLECVNDDFSASDFDRIVQEQSSDDSEKNE